MEREPRPSWWRRPKPTLLTAAFLIGLASGVLQIWQFLESLASDDDAPSTAWLFAGIGLPLAVLLLVLAYVIVEFRRQLATTVEGYALQLQALVRQSEKDQMLQRLCSRVADRAHQLSLDLIASDASYSSDGQLANHLRQMCRAFAQLLSFGLQDECRVCVKLIQHDKSHRYPYVTTLCRNAGTASETDIHYIHLNTAFNELLADNRDYWLADDVEAMPGYRNTNPQRRYRSVLIWPIFADKKLATVPLPGWPDSIVAFLCADSEEVGVFNKDDHVHAGLPMVDMASWALDLHLRAGAAPPGWTRGY